MAGAVPRPRRQGTLPPLLPQDRRPELARLRYASRADRNLGRSRALPNHGRRDGPAMLTGKVNLKPSMFALYESMHPRVDPPTFSRAGAMCC